MHVETPTRMPRLGEHAFVRPAEEEHVSAKRIKLSHPTTDSPYKNPTTTTTTDSYANQDYPTRVDTEKLGEYDPTFCPLKASCGTKTSRKICKKEGPNKDRAFYTCACQEEGGFIWEDVWASKCFSNPKTVLKCGPRDQNQPANDSLVSKQLNLFKAVEELQGRLEELITALEGKFADIDNKLDAL
jgi:hypothetical protein